MFIVYAERGGCDTYIRFSTTTFLRLSGPNILWFSVILVYIVCDVLVLVVVLYCRPMLLYIVFQAGLTFIVHTVTQVYQYMTP